MRRTLALALILMTLLASPAFARKWTSRAGGFSLDAELVDVRDGNAVLKKTDGTEVVVPLNKLSLSDVRYIQAELKSAEKGVGASPRQTPARWRPRQTRRRPQPPTR